MKRIEPDRFEGGHTYTIADTFDIMVPDGATTRVVLLLNEQLGAELGSRDDVETAIQALRDAADKAWPRQ